MLNDKTLRNRVLEADWLPWIYTAWPARPAVVPDLAAPANNVMPVCLAKNRVYNVDYTLWAAILAQQDEAGRVRLLRCLEARKRVENWALLGRQLANAGRFLLDLPKRAWG